MSPTVIAAFIAACILLGLTPGPNMSLIVANTLASGLRAGLATLAGAGLGLTILITLAAAGMSSVMVFMADWFDIVRWVGAVYLLLLGARQLWGWWQRRGSGLPPPPVKSSSGVFLQGLIVSLSNPKVILFLGAFLPQFVDPARNPVPQLVVLAVLFIVTLILVDVAYTVAIARARATLDPRRLSALDGIAGALLMVGGFVLATARRP